MQLYIPFSDDKDKPLCSPLLKSKPGKSSDQQAAPDLNTIENNIEGGKYESVAQFDADMGGVFSAVLREQGRVSALGNIAVQLKKVCLSHGGVDIKLSYLTNMGDRNGMASVNGELKRNVPRACIHSAHCFFLGNFRCFIYLYFCGPK